MAHNPTVRAAVNPARFVVAATGLAAAAVWVSIGRDQTLDAGAALMQLPWLALSCLLLLVAVTGVHFACAGAAIRGVSGRRLPWRETGLVQLAAAATNRLVPSGVGAAAVNSRYLIRSGLTVGEAAGALGTLAAVGALTDAAYVAGITTIGPAIGLGGARAELSTLVARGITSGQHHWWLPVGIVALAVTAAAVFLRGRVIRSTIAAVRDAASHLLRLVTHPRAVAGAAAASMATTAVLSLGFVAAVRMWGHAANPLSAGALIALFWVAEAIGNATPLPAIFGLTEASLIGGLVLAHYAPTSATIVVIAFRLLTFWLPLPLGVWAARHLHRAHVL